MTHLPTRLGPYLTVAEVQAAARCSRSTVARAVAYGDLASHKAHRRRLIAARDVERWIEVGCPITYPVAATTRAAS